HQGFLHRRMEEAVDGEYQNFKAAGGAYTREHFFGKYPELAEMVATMSDEDIWRLNRGGHDPHKVYAAYRAAVEYEDGPTVVLAKTIKGYGLGEAGEGRNITHKQKELNEAELLSFRSRFDVPLGDDEVADAPFFRLEEDSDEMKYLHDRRAVLGGSLPARVEKAPTLEVPPLEDFERLLEGSGERTASTTMSFDRILNALLKNDAIGQRIVPIIPDEARTFGLETLFGRCGIYSPHGQRYDPVDAEKLIHYKEAVDGQLLEEGISEAGAMSSFIAAGTAYSSLATPMIPFYLFYSMFGFQRVGDLIWAAADARAKGFLLGCTAGRTTLNGEGLQHQDGHSQLVATTVPNLQAYDPAYAYEVAVIVKDGLRRMYQEGETLLYYLTLYNQSYEMPAMPDGAEKGILRGMYEVSRIDAGDDGAPRAQLFGSGTILQEVLAAQQLLADEFDVASDVWSVTSYCRLRRDARAAQRRNRLNPNHELQRSYLEEVLDGRPGPFVAATDYVSLVPDQIAPWISGRYVTLGTEGFGRSDTKAALREHFEVSAAHIALATLTALVADEQFDKERLVTARNELGIDPEKLEPVTA
ncbi:MAG: pyruvate dehydrogenase (acetyl-transferring), homodimeric type, partial [Planctomycetales bacterium]|nr:pyruvate dehydrogenase (acetyl-transferring), homodimeric type [Planctomycetales bacterium]